MSAMIFFPSALHQFEVCGIFGKRANRRRILPLFRATDDIAGVQACLRQCQLDLPVLRLTASMTDPASPPLTVNLIVAQASNAPTTGHSADTSGTETCASGFLLEF